MPPLTFRLQVAFKALDQLGLPTIILYTRYQLGLRSGWYRLRSGPAQARQVVRTVQSNPQVRLAAGLLPLPSPQDLSEVLGEAGRNALMAEADEILQGRVRLFGADPVPLQLHPAFPLSHWTAHARRQDRTQDIKFTWEPARFGWAIILARAYRLSADERYAVAFWEYTQRFMDGNPPYNGPNWVSAQEVALRLIAVVFACQVFAASPHSTADRLGWLAGVVAQHAARLPLTLAYSKALNNNHLLSEAAGLITAALALPLHPASTRWLRLGWRCFTGACQTQFDPHGAYLQHSASYQRLALHLSLWVHSLLHPVGHALDWPPGQAESLPSSFSPSLLQRLSSATRWLLDLQDPTSGCLPNLGPNDGALLLPLSACSISDYYPVLQAASLAFLGQRSYPPGPWDEALLWLGLPPPAYVEQAVSLLPSDPVQQPLHPSSSAQPASLPPSAYVEQALDWPPGQAVSLPPSDPVKQPLHPISSAQPASSTPSRTPHLLRSSDRLSWAYLRLAHFSSRPGHADQLHFDLWWRGHNLAQDAGTFLYNGLAPWDNPLTSTAYHNTLTVDGQDQVLRAGRFLFLDWAQARLLSSSDCSLAAEHDGYRRLGLLHRRSVSVTQGAWRIEDTLLPLSSFRPVSRTACLHWLLPDWEFNVTGSQPPGNHASRFGIALASPNGQLHISLTGSQCVLQIARAGELVYGNGPTSPTWGWVSPTYGLKVPALSVRLSQAAVPPISFTTQFDLPG